MTDTINSGSGTYQETLSQPGHDHTSSTYPALDLSYSNLDRAFDDLFDYGMPNVFRDPNTWESFHLSGLDDESLGGGSEIQFPSAYYGNDVEGEIMTTGLSSYRQQEEHTT